MVSSVLSRLGGRISILKISRKLRVLSVPASNIVFSGSPSFSRHFSSSLDGVVSKSEDSKAVNDNDKGVVIYTGLFGGKLRWLRRVSVTSTIFSLIGFPYVYAFGLPTTNVSLAGQIAIVGTALATSSLSTVFLQTITHPYVFELSELQTETAGDRTFSATRINIFGNLTNTTFKLSEAKRVTAARHPFASFEANGNFYYVFGGSKIGNSEKGILKDESLVKALTNESQDGV